MAHPLGWSLENTRLSCACWLARDPATEGRESPVGKAAGRMPDGGAQQEVDLRAARTSWSLIVSSVLQKGGRTALSVEEQECVFGRTKAARHW